MRRAIQGSVVEQVGSRSNGSGAIFSPDRVYRYVLWRAWGTSARRLVVIGLNPSTADATTNDRTVSRCIGFAKRERCGGLVMLNVFALRATDPKVMLAHPEPVGRDNDRYLTEWTSGGNAIVVAAWGVGGMHRSRDREVCQLPTVRRRSLRCLGITQAGTPKHPLYIAGDTALVPFLRRQ